MNGPTHTRPALRLAAAGFRVCRGLLLIALCASTAIAAGGAREYQVKAAFLYNFTRFVEWPEYRFSDPSAPIVIGVLGTDPFGGELEAVVRGRRVNGRPIAVRRVLTTAEQREVHVLFVGTGAEKLLDGSPPVGVLTVGESERFEALGGMITFIAEADKVRFIVNLRSAADANLKLSSQLLKVAKAVRRTR